MYNLLLGPPPRYARRRLLPLVVELRPQGLVVVSGLAALLGPSALCASVWPKGHPCTSLGLRACKTQKIKAMHNNKYDPLTLKKLLATKVPQKEPRKNA
ncbi:hypothetical protein SapgrDRAFT_2657 [Saprospira grandis DSM 2844]|uniref:Uncharacterized protein n=1 Tax=Saprospira grandis DSM 2844 TaxID=694433 RepID=J1I7B2_9BACT|nr:hypothetical protein SapgrDRAFT_2657 [Saprospira grandis DSM 2844]